MSLNYWRKIDRQIDRWKLKKRSLAKFSYVQNCLSNFDFALTNNERALERRKIGDRPPSNNLTHTDTLYEKAIDSFRPVDDAERENRQNTIATPSSRESAILLRKKCERDEIINWYKNVPFIACFDFSAMSRKTCCVTKSIQFDQGIPKYAVAKQRLTCSEQIGKIRSKISFD